MNKILTAFVGAKISEFRKKMADVNRIIHQTATGTEIPVDGNIKPISAKIAEVKAKLTSIRDKTVEIKADIDKRWDNMNNMIDSMADKFRNVSTVGQATMSGLATAVSSLSIPAIASLAAGIGSLGPILAVAAGGAAGLGTAFSIAGAGAAAFGAVAVTNLNDVFEANKKISDIQDKLAVTDDVKKRNKLLQQQASILNSMDKSQLRAYQSMQKLKGVWSGITEPLKAQTVNIFSKALDALSTVLGYLKPTFSGATQAVDNLLSSLNKALGMSDVKTFFYELGYTVGPAMETLGKAGMNVMLGLMNLFSMFIPLGVKMQNGLLGMSESFLNWTRSVSQSTAFQKFISYVQTNGPKLLQIVGNIGSGIIGMFTGFAPTASSMLDALVNLTNQFKVWGQTLASNQQFQQFIGYVNANAPQLISLLGNVVQIIGALAVGLAPVGQAVLNMLVPFTQWVGETLKAHPAIASVVGSIVALGGILVAVTPHIIAFNRLFGGISTVVGLAKKSFGLLVGAFKLIGSQALINGARMAAGWVIAMGPVGWVITAVVALVALVIANWNTVKKWTIQIWGAISSWLGNLWNGIKGMASSVWNGIKSVVSSVWNWIKSTTSSIWNGIKSFLSGLWNGIKSVASSAWNGIKNTIVNLVKGAGNNIKNIWNGIKSFLSGLWNGIKSIASSIWNGVKNSVINIVRNMGNGIKNAWNTIKSATSSAFNSVVGFIKNPLKKIDLFGIGKDIIQGLINGIKSLAGKVGNAIKDIAGGIKDKITGFLGIGSPSKYMAWIGKMTGQGLVNGIAGMQRKVASVSQNMAHAAAIEPQRTSFSYDASMSNGDFGRVKQDFAANLEGTETQKQPISLTLEIDSRQLAQIVEPDVSKLQNGRIRLRARQV